MGKRSHQGGASDGVPRDVAGLSKQPRDGGGLFTRILPKTDEAMDEYRLLVLHHMNDGSEYLVQAKSVEVLKKPPELKDAWEYTLSYRRRNRPS